MNPTVAGFLTWIRQIMGVSVGNLPSDSAYIQLAYDNAIAIVNLALANVPSPRTSPSIYAQAVYNLGGDTLVNIVQDPVDAPIYRDGLQYWAWLRKSFSTYTFIGGVIQSASDEGTSESMVVSDSLKQLTLLNLQQLRSPWGRAYLAIAQSYGPSVWGIT